MNFAIILAVTLAPVFTDNMVLQRDMPVPIWGTANPAEEVRLNLAGCIVRVDALNCQKNIAKEISEADADYVLALKGNHAVAYDEVKTFLEDARQQTAQAA